MAVVTSSIQDTSFSSYLSSTNEKTMLRKLGDQKPSLNLISPIITITTSPSKHLGNSKKEEEDEIGVFGAEKYFNGAMDEDSSRSSTSPCSSMKLYVHQKHQLVNNNLDHVKLKVKQHGTPSVRSEASSWNSQSALLKSGSRKPKRADKTMATRKKGFFAALGCSCSDKNSVDVNDHQHDGEISFKQNGVNIKQSLDLVSEAIVKIKQAPESWVKEEILKNGEKIEKLGAGLSRENCFAFPDANSEAMSNLRSKIPLFQEIEDEKVRKSIEVFGAPVSEKRKKAIGLEKRLSLMSWEAKLASVKSGGNYAVHESDSDASSDLFEIESLKGKNNPFLARQASDGCATPTHCYAPSEVSVDWSVVTASAADFSYAMSDCEDLGRPRSPTNAANAKSARMSKEMAPIKNRSNVLLGCKSHKAVQVADNAHRPQNPKTIIDPPIMPCKPAMPLIPSTRFPGETNSKLTGFESRVHALAPKSVPHVRSPHTSHLLYMQ